MEDGVKRLGTIQEALESAKNVDSEFKKIYGKWNKVDKEVKDLDKQYNRLKSDANNLFDAMKRQTESLNDQTTKSQLLKAITKTESDYQPVLTKTSKAIEKLNALHGEAVDVIKALEVAVALGQISEISSGLKSIEDKVAVIMKDLNETIKESKDLYDERIGNF